MNPPGGVWFLQRRPAAVSQNSQMLFRVHGDVQQLHTNPGRDRTDKPAASDQPGQYAKVEPRLVDRCGHKGDHTSGHQDVQQHQQD